MDILPQVHAFFLGYFCDFIKKQMNFLYNKINTVFYLRGLHENIFSHSSSDKEIVTAFVNILVKSNPNVEVFCRGSMEYLRMRDITVP